MRTKERKKGRGRGSVSGDNALPKEEQRRMSMQHSRCWKIGYEEGKWRDCKWRGRVREEENQKKRNTLKSDGHGELILLPKCLWLDDGMHLWCRGMLFCFAVQGKVSPHPKGCLAMQNLDYKYYQIVSPKGKNPCTFVFFRYLIPSN
jgi:hypothetical protein